jgi:hypothetical protein
MDGNNNKQEGVGCEIAFGHKLTNLQTKTIRNLKTWGFEFWSFGMLDFSKKNKLQMKGERQ